MIAAPRECVLLRNQHICTQQTNIHELTTLYALAFYLHFSLIKKNTLWSRGVAKIPDAQNQKLTISY